MKAEMVNSSNHTSATVDETVETQTIDIDMDLLKKEQDASTDPNETWTGLNDSCNNIRGDGDETVKSGSVGSEPRRKFSRRNSNESVCSKGSTGSSGSKSSSKSASKRKSMTKRRSWKKPKDKPKRPLSAYNIFFKHTRSRIVEGLPEQGTTQETIASIEGIVANSTETRRHRKTHGQISFGDLARTIADKWKTIDKDHRALFDHYAALDMKRYRREVSIWKAKKEAEALAGSGEGGARSSTNLEVSGNSCLTDSQASIEGGENYNEWNTLQARALTSSFNSVDSDDDFGIVEPLPIAESQNGMIGHSVPSFIGSSSNGNMNNMMAADNVLSMNASNSGYGNDMSGDSIQSRKLQDIWMKNRQLEDSINKLKKELSATNFQLGNSGNNMNMNGNPESTGNAKFMNSPFQGGPSIDRMQQLHRRRLMMGDIMPQMANGQIHPNQLGMNGNNNNTVSGNFVQGGLGGNNEMQMEPFDMNPVPFEEVFNATGDEASMKKRELITNLNQIDFFGNGGGN